MGTDKKDALIASAILSAFLISVALMYFDREHFYVHLGNYFVWTNILCVRASLAK